MDNVAFFADKERGQIFAEAAARMVSGPNSGSRHKKGNPLYDHCRLTSCLVVW
jgi:hypothetical protein